MTTKRQIDQDPDYESIPAELQQKRLRLIEQDAREFTIKKIEKIIRTQFGKEIKMKESELQLIDEKLQEARMILDRLRACIVMKYYSSNGEQIANSSPSVHPTVKKCLGKSPKFHPQEKSVNSHSPNIKISPSDIANSTAISKSADTHNSRENDVGHGVRLKRKLSIIVGNVSKYIPADSRDENDQATHKWMVYVRGNKDNPHIENVIKKVQFFLHPSYRPNDLVEVCDPPFHLTRRGWGEFPVRVQLHFHNQSNKPVDIIHNLKLDKTYTGLQTLGAETAVDLWLFRKEAKQKLTTINCRRNSSFIKNSTEKDLGLINCNIVKSEEILSNNHKTESVDTHKSSLETNGILPEVSKVQPLENNCSHPKPTVEISLNQKNSKLPVEEVKKTKSVLLIIPPTINKTIVAQETLQQPQLQNFLAKQIQESSPKKIIPVPLNSNFPKTSLDPTCVSQVMSMTLNNKNNLCQKTTTNNSSSVADLNLNTSLNGLTTFVKCMDNQGRILLVPQSSVVKLPNSLKTKSGIGESLIQSNQNNQFSAEFQKSNAKCASKTQKNVSSYMLKVLPNHTGNMNQVILIPASQTNVDNEHSLKKVPSTNLHSVTFSNLSSNKTLDKSICFDNTLSGKNNTKIPKKDDALALKKALLSIRLEYYETMFELTNKVVKLFPLINKDIDRSCHPYCAPSLEIYYSWNIGKQRAAEWQRAKSVRQAILQLLNQKTSTFRPKDVWSTKEIMVWCYRNGYSPKRQSESVPNSQHHFGVLSEVSTITESKKLLEILEKEESVPETNLSEEEVDILNTENDHSCITSKNTHKDNIFLDRMSYNQSLLSIPNSSACVEFVKEAASKIGIKFQPCELAPSIMGHVIEEMILASCKEFISDVLRVALSESFDKIGKKLYPDTIRVEDIFSAIQKLPLCDIFTNKYLGVSPVDQQSENK